MSNLLYNNSNYEHNDFSQQLLDVYWQLSSDEDKTLQWLNNNYPKLTVHQRADLLEVFSAYYFEKTADFIGDKQPPALKQIIHEDIANLAKENRSHKYNQWISFYRQEQANLASIEFIVSTLDLEPSFPTNSLNSVFGSNKVFNKSHLQAINLTAKHGSQLIRAIEQEILKHFLKIREQELKELIIGLGLDDHRSLLFLTSNKLHLRSSKNAFLPYCNTHNKALLPARREDWKKHPDKRCKVCEKTVRQNALLSNDNHEDSSDFAELPLLSKQDYTVMINYCLTSESQFLSSSVTPYRQSSNIFPIPENKQQRGSAYYTWKSTAIINPFLASKLAFFLHRDQREDVPEHITILNTLAKTPAGVAEILLDAYRENDYNLIVTQEKLTAI